jgi:hypothetical protein
MRARQVITGRRMLGLRGGGERDTRGHLVVGIRPVLGGAWELGGGGKAGCTGWRGGG